MSNKVTIDEVEKDMNNLYFLLSVVNDVLGEMNFGKDDERNKSMDKIFALNAIAEDRARGIVEKIAANYSSLTGR